MSMFRVRGPIWRMTAPRDGYYCMPHFTDGDGHSSSVQFSSVTQSCPTLQPHESQHARPPCPSPTPRVYTNSCPSSHLILCHPLLLLPSIFPSIRVFFNQSTLCMRWPKYWSIIPSKEHPGLISFRMDWLELLAVQGTLKSLLQYRS